MAPRRCSSIRCSAAKRCGRSCASAAACRCTSPETMWASLRVIRQRGFSFDDEEHLVGTRCVASPIYDEHAESFGAISLAGPVSRLPDARIKQLGPVVAHIAEEISRKLGGRWPHPY